MIRKAGERDTAVASNVRGGNLSITSDIMLKVEDFNQSGRLFNRITFPPTASIGYHVHEGETETFYILKGTAKYNDNGTETIIGAGDVTFTNTGEGHSIENIGDGELELIALIMYDKR